MPLANLRASVLASRDKLKSGRERLRQLHRGGAAGEEVSRLLADLTDRIVSELFRLAVDEHGDEGVAARLSLVPHGGYGRRDVAPFSDVDLMLLYADGADRRVRPVVQRLTQDICDVGLVLGHSLRTPAGACELAMQDATVFTSMAEARWLGGSEELYASFVEQFQREVRRGRRSLFDGVEAARQAERNRYGQTVFLLTPNVKRSYGGLRDIQLVRWIGLARYRERELPALEQLGALDVDDRQQLEAAHEFLLRVRNEMHFHAGKAQDVVDRFEQVRLAEHYGYSGEDGLLPVEQFMRDYFRHTGNVRYSAAHFVATARARSGIHTLLNSLASHDVEGDFRVGPLHIGATRRGLAKVGSDLAQVLRLMDLANLYNKRIDHRTWRTIRQAMGQLKDTRLTGSVATRFLSLISQPARLGHLLRQLHELRVLEKFIPGLSHATCLLQFNEYHKYTIDEHCIRAVEAATEFLDQTGPLGDAYRSLKNKRTLHLALLMHDLGKGYAEDHSEVGARLADEAASRLRLPANEAEILRLLVHKHLLLSHLAQFRDINDAGVVVELAVQAGSPEVLRMLYVLACADLAAVGPGVLNRWKLEIFTQLYQNALRQLTGDWLAGASDDEHRRRRQTLRERVPGPPDAWWDRQIEAVPLSLLDDPSARILQDLTALRELPADETLASARYAPEYRAVEYTIGANEALTPGIFHRLTGVLTSHRMEILSAQIATLADGLVLDRFYVQDNDFEGPPPAERLQDICRRLVESLKRPSDEPPKFPQLWGERAAGPFPRVPRLPAKVQIDNNTSDRFTILDIFATDRMGLLYTITRMLYDFGLSVHMAKIGTHLDQVVDVFYVTDGAGEKICDDQRLQQIASRLLARIVEFEETGLRV